LVVCVDESLVCDQSWTELGVIGPIYLRPSPHLARDGMFVSYCCSCCWRSLTEYDSSSYRRSCLAMEARMSAISGVIAALIIAAKSVWRNFLMSLISSCIGARSVGAGWLVAMLVGRAALVMLGVLLSFLLGVFWVLVVGLVFSGFLGREGNFSLSNEYVGCLMCGRPGVLANFFLVSLLSCGIDPSSFSAYEVVAAVVAIRSVRAGIGLSAMGTKFLFFGRCLEKMCGRH